MADIPMCPVCGADAKYNYIDFDGYIVGCENCITIEKA